ncbi:TROVE domain-containing protein [Chitinophaga sp. Cy-1792]|uniref:TROVE domain-containing protein n=1 Tax=Chitinophaga sp. Cy-1792 TaxID=2608339 RepID=UPI001424928B|nr:TROVE domain-containing protein [Chitinophaga sp. Cy-1792]NIG53891.1 TROVE domain-containing protein [Chitinophaga sp. Cy-1792]
MKFNLMKRKNGGVTNHEGFKAYALNTEMELYSSVVTSSLSDQFYESGAERMDRIKALLQEADPAFIAKLAVYAREKMYLRSIPMALTVELAKRHKGDALVSKTVARVVQRADEITELLACYVQSNGRVDTKKLSGLSKQLQKGLSASFNRFDEYQFAKYNRDTAITLRDALFLVHPKPKDEAQQLLFNKIAQQQLETPYTWETAISAVGQQRYASETARQAAVRQTWEALITDRKLGYMAMMRNLRNMLQADISAAHIQQVCDTLSDPAEVQRSKQLPFRFLAAYRELKAVPHGLTGKIQQALEMALQASVANMKGFNADTKVVIACDVSGSMQRPISARSKILSYDIGLMLGMLLQFKSQHVVSGMFGDTWKIIQMPTNQILASVDEFYRRQGEVGYATFGYKVIEDLINRNYVADKVMLFTDCQLYGDKTLQNAWNRYKQIAPQAKLYLFDLAGYGNTPIDILANDVNLIAGWSDKVFEVLEALENGEDALSHINNITL